MTTSSGTIPEVRLEDLAATGIAPLEEAGCLVITGVTGASERDRLREELAEGMAGARVWEGDDPKAFFPGYTRRIASMVARSETARDWVMHPLAKTLCDHFLLPNCDDRYQLHVTAAIEIGPGARKQRPMAGPPPRNANVVRARSATAPPAAQPRRPFNGTPAVGRCAPNVGCSMRGAAPGGGRVPVLPPAAPESHSGHDVVRDGLHGGERRDAARAGQPPVAQGAAGDAG